MSKKHYNKPDWKERMYPEETTTPSVEEPSVPTPAKGKIVNAKLVNLRKKPSLNAEILRTIDENATFDVLVRIGQFWKVKTKDGTTGFIAAEYCEEV